MSENNESKDVTTEKMFNEEEFLKKVEEAAKKGAKKPKGNPIFGLLKLIQPLLTFAIFAMFVVGFINVKGSFSAFFGKLGGLITTDTAGNHDYVVEDHGIFGFTAADFAEAILGEAKNTKVLEVYKREVSDVGTITDAGAFGLKALTKTQVLTYHATAVYTVDLEGLSEKSFVVDTNAKRVVMSVPAVKLDHLIVPVDKIEYADPEKGLLAFGDIRVTPEQSANIQHEAEEKMKTKLVDENVIDEAAKAAQMELWQLYQPLVANIAPGYTLEIQFN